MLYLGIDQHARQLTISLRDDSGDVLLAWQVSTRELVNEFAASYNTKRNHMKRDWLPPWNSMSDSKAATI